MLGRLEPEEIEAVLERGIIIHLGCHTRGRTYVVPITYAYANGDVFGHTSDGLKLTMMRDNPEVCVQVEEIEGPTSWRSVIAWGVFEPLVGEQSARALQILLDHYASHEAKQARRGPLGPHRRQHIHPNALIYRIHLTEKTGRFERPDDTNAAAQEKNEH